MNMGNEGVNYLGRVLQTRMCELDDKPPLLDYGEIQSDMSLVTNKFPCPVPQSDYMVCRSVQWGAVDDEFYRTANDGDHDHGRAGNHHHTLAACAMGVPHPPTMIDGDHGHPSDEPHEHVTLIGDRFRWLQPGDRVLVAWVGDEPCVIDLIYPATNIGR
ncbi:MAG: hypothetical protein FWE40_04845 [Oscillospiraceae bacterium]|nr:hypothetical protein [Oscillospiraceae bacterium]